MLNFLIIAVMLAITICLGYGLFFLVRDHGKSSRTVKSLSLRVGLAVLLLALLAFGFITRFITP
ncbi:MAG: hypothetical protein CMM56_05175 [Rhodospirillaceae bacterium]|nr:hypothetical protein [Rhodospirillaceae bacterium]